MRLRPDCGTRSHYVGLLFAHLPDFGCLLSTKSTLANSSCDCRQLFADSTLANSDLGGSVLARETFAKSRDSLELAKLANCCMTFATSALARETFAKSLAASPELANCLTLTNCCLAILPNALPFVFLNVETTQVEDRCPDCLTSGGASHIFLEHFFNILKACGTRSVRRGGADPSQ